MNIKKWGYDKVAVILVWYLCKTQGFEYAGKSYKQIVINEKKVLPHQLANISWDVPIPNVSRLERTNQIMYSLIKKYRRITLLMWHVHLTQQ